MEKPLTEYIKAGKALSLKEYEQHNGYQGVRKALKEMAPTEVTDVVKQSQLTGRGGAGFLTGLKWSFVSMTDDAPRPKYLIANADEMEPGTYKDRLLLEGNPHQLIEGMMIAAYAIQAEIAYVFLRWAYKTAAHAVQEAIAEAYQAGYLGKNIFGSDYNLDIYLHTSVGRYMCGEETGLLNALEGKRAIARSKPPYPQISGLFGKPTVVNNVETLSCVPHIIRNDAHWFLDLSLTEEGGTKLYGVSGKVNNPGLWELPMGTPMREIIEEYAQGMKNGLRFRGAIPGGASTDFLVEEHLDIKMDFGNVSKAGSRLGTGTMIILDDQTCPVGFVLNLMHFFAQESCGWSTPCREGLPWIEKILLSIEKGSGQLQDLEILEAHTKMLGPGRTFCALAPGAMEPLQSALKYFKDDFIKHIRDKACPWRS